MAVLEFGRTVRQQRPEILVENRLRPGRWRFRLVVVDDSGHESEPAELVITVREERAPTPPIFRGPLLFDALPFGRRADLPEEPRPIDRLSLNEPDDQPTFRPIIGPGRRPQ